MAVALLFEAHTIRSRVPRLFDGRLPDINLGTADGKSCASDLAALLIETAGEAEAYTSVLNGRFKGGYITRHYGRPADGVHAVQLELAQLHLHGRGSALRLSRGPGRRDPAGAERHRGGHDRLGEPPLTPVSTAAALGGR